MLCISWFALSCLEQDTLVLSVHGADSSAILFAIVQHVVAYNELNPAAGSRNLVQGVLE